MGTVVNAYFRKRWRHRLNSLVFSFFFENTDFAFSRERSQTHTFVNDDVIDVMLIIHFQLFWRLLVDRLKRSINDKWISLDGKHSMRLQYVNVYVWTGPKLFNQEFLMGSILVQTITSFSISSFL